MSVEGYFKLSLLDEVHSADSLHRVVSRVESEDCESYYFLDTLSQRISNLVRFDPRSFFNEIYQSCEDDDDRSYVKHILKEFQHLLNTAHIDRVFPFLVKAFECHQRARTFFLNGQSQEAMAEMGKTVIFAEIIAETHQTLGQPFFDLHDKVWDKMKDLFEKNGYKRSEKLNFIPLSTALLDINAFLKSIGMNAKSLCDPELAKPLSVKLMEEPLPEAAQEFYQRLEAAEKALPEIRPSPKTMTDVVKVMKTGSALPSPKKTELVDMLRFNNPDGIEANFALSFSEWLSLTKIHAIVIEILSGFLRDIDGLDDEFSLIEKLNHNN